MRWNTPDGLTLLQIRERLAKSPTALGSWFHNQQFTYDSVAVACNIPLDHWDKMTPEQQGRTVEVYQSRRTMDEWIAHLSRPKAEA